ncbi:MAG: thioredoxin family protein, partial [Acidimicrobiales bacterium]
MEIRLLLADDCPHVTLVRARLNAALARLRLPAAVRETVVSAAAPLADFAGSPTILVDGRDLFTVGDRAPGLSCRIYQTPAGLQGSPTVEQLVAALRPE